MKNILIAVLLIASVALGALFLKERNARQSQTAQLAQAETRLAGVETQVQEKTDAVESARFAENKAKILQETLTATAASAEAKSKEVASLQAAAKTNNAANPLAAMFKDPKMKELIKSQQKMVMGPMIEKSYAGLFKQLSLTSEQSAGLKDLLQGKMLVAADLGMSMMDGSLDAAKRAELGKQMKTDTEAYDAQIKQFLGDDNYKAFEGYEKTMPDRMAVGQFSDQLAGSATPMSADQQQQLIQALNQERTSFKWTTDYSSKTPGDMDYASMFSEEKLNRFASEKEQFDQQFLDRAKAILTPEQYVAYEKHQATQREMQINAMKMAAKMFSQ